MSYSPQAFNTATSTSLGEVKIGSGFTLAGDGTLNNGGVTQLTGAATIKVSAATGPVTITDVGVFSVTGTANQVTASASTGAVTLSLPQSIATTSSVTFGTLTASTSLIGLGYTSLGTGVGSSNLYNAVPLLVRSGAGSGGGVNAWFSQSGDKLFVASVNDTGSYIPFVFRASTYAFQNSANGGNGQLGVHILDVANNFAAFNTTTQYSGATLNVNGGAYVNGPTTSTGSILTSGTGGIGYATGAGASVTQSTSITTPVTINALSGSITQFNTTRAAGITFFTVTNSLVSATDVVIVNMKSSSAIVGQVYSPMAYNITNGSFMLQVNSNASTGATLDAPVFNFAVIKAVNA